MTIPFINAERAGFLPTFLDYDDEDDAVTQLDKNYGHGGGWRDMEGFKFALTKGNLPSLVYPGDPPLEAVAFGMLRGEVIILYEADFVAVVQKNGDFRVARMD